ncbi:odorant receptor 49b-like [Temnothorax curvispinosus]|uniref:Odorant receptor n=2 Tax=Temnothorax curvispinosus TaxID=300111 RepID=A0A6J1QWI4_9HYME|nr:odorant receptor 49b-like [Temnothorax curvispinosus]
MIFWWKKEAIIPIIDMIAEDWGKSKNVQERNIMIRRAQTARIIITCAYCIMGVACLFVIILPIFGISTRLTPNITDPGKVMPLQTHYIYDITKRPQYELTYISQAIYIVLAIMSYIGIDHFLGLLVFHISGQLDILKDRLTHLDKYINSHDMLRRCVARHIRLLRAIAVIEDTYNITFLLLFTYFAILFAFCGFSIITLFDEGNDLSLTRLVYFVSLIFNLFGHMCLYCALGEFLVTQCDEIYYAAYSNEWYSVDPKLTQDLLFLLIRGAKPIYLTAGKMFPVTMTTFCNLFDEGNDLSISRLVFFILTIFNLFGHMCLYCVLGDILMAQCNKIYYAAYSNKWYTMDPQITENLLILMTRNSKPIYLTAGKISPVTMATFCSLVKTSVGYISVLYTMRR